MYCKGIFTSEYKKTIGVDFLEKRICLNGEDIRLMLWDTAGQEEFDCITRAYYRGAQACVLAFSCVDRESFKQVEEEGGGGVRQHPHGARQDQEQGRLSQRLQNP